VAPALSAQAGIQFDAANPAIVTDAAFKNPLRESLAIYYVPLFKPRMYARSKANQTL
jgi:hypothetical protein